MFVLSYCFSRIEFSRVTKKRNSHSGGLVQYDVQSKKSMLKRFQLVIALDKQVLETPDEDDLPISHLYQKVRKTLFIYLIWFRFHKLICP